MLLQRFSSVSFFRSPVNCQIFVGGVDNTATLPWHFATRRRDRFFRGCLWDLRFDDQPNVVELVKPNQRLSAGIQASCHVPSTGECSRGQCENGGQCRERWEGPICDCSRTAYTGDRCERGKYLRDVWSSGCTCNACRCLTRNAGLLCKGMLRASCSLLAISQSAYSVQFCFPLTVW